jgi:NitT/TauT family transport system permease protein
VTRVLVRYAPLLVVAAGWEIAVQGGLVSRLALPPLEAVFGALGDLIGSGELLQNGVASVYRAALGLLLAVLVGGALGLAMATSRAARIVANPLVQIFYPMPKSALIPLMLIWFGFGDLSKVVLIFLGCLLPVIVSTYNGARGVEDRLVWSARSLGASARAIVWDVRLPAALPEILNGVRTALAFAFILMVSSELIIARDGLGYMIGTLGDGGAYPFMFAVILTVVVLGFLADRAYGAAARRLLRWRE